MSCQRLASNLCQGRKTAFELWRRRELLLLLQQGQMLRRWQQKGWILKA